MTNQNHRIYNRVKLIAWLFIITKGVSYIAMLASVPVSAVLLMFLVVYILFIGASLIYLFYSKNKKTKEEKVNITYLPKSQENLEINNKW